MTDDKPMTFEEAIDEFVRYTKHVADSRYWNLVRIAHAREVEAAFENGYRHAADLLPCKHPRECLRQIDDAPFCAWCSDIEVARREEREACAQKVEFAAPDRPFLAAAIRARKP